MGNKLKIESDADCKYLAQRIIKYLDKLPLKGKARYDFVRKDKAKFDLIEITTKVTTKQKNYLIDYLYENVRDLRVRVRIIDGIRKNRSRLKDNRILVDISEESLERLICLQKENKFDSLNELVAELIVKN